jgi:hypothetical protein
MNKVIYLDLEGVVVSIADIIARTDEQLKEYYTYRDIWNQFVNKSSWNLICRAAQIHNAKIVLTSTLRRQEGIIDQLNKVRNTNNQDYDLWHSSPITDSGSSREQEIRDHASANGVTKYSVIDDRKLDMPELINIDPVTGFTAYDFYKLQDALADTPESVRKFRIFL